MFTLVKVMAPYTPFLTEHMYQYLKNYMVGDELSEVEKGSVHFQMLPQPRWYIEIIVCITIYYDSKSVRVIYD